MYVSTAYSNAHLKKYSTVKEQLYPLREQDGREVDHAAIVDRLLAMPVDEAQREVSVAPKSGLAKIVASATNWKEPNFVLCSR